LEEVARADLVVHVVDSCAPDALSQVTAVRGSTRSEPRSCLSCSC
jgi:50S ribosomal subunit-associated GTPase HflX